MKHITKEQRRISEDMEGITTPIIKRSKTALKISGIKQYAPSAETPEAIIDDLETIYHRDKFYALTSGGKDSMSICHWLAERNKLEAAVHIQTNIGVRQTTESIKDVDPQLYEYIEWLEDGVKRFGGPGSKKHPKWGLTGHTTDMENQEMLDKFLELRPDLKNIKEMEGIICGAECGPGTLRSTEDY